MPESTFSPFSALPNQANSFHSQLNGSTVAVEAKGDTHGGVSSEGSLSLQREKILKAAKTLLQQQHKSGLKLSDANSQPLQVSIAMMSPSQLQQLLSPSQLQALLQQQQHAILLQQQHLKDFYKKQQQQIYLQLLQQQIPDQVKELSLQQLVFQHQVLKLRGPILPPHTLSTAGLSPDEFQHTWRELGRRLVTGETLGTSPDCTNIASTPSSTPSTASVKRIEEQSPAPRQDECSDDVDSTGTQWLYSHGVCNWPGCESVCENISQFIRHLGSEHTLDDRSTAQCRVQMQVVQQLDLQLSKERERLQAMMAHLHLPPPEPQTPSMLSDSLSSVNTVRNQYPPSPPELPLLSPPPTAPLSPLSQGSGGPNPISMPSMGAMKRRHADQRPSLIPLSDSGLAYELYKNADIRPPFTYATLIRQAIVEAPDMQLTLSEIYSWFTKTFAHFRRNAATWKNAVRHNLSLHKCFVRVENVKGAVWTVDEEEYQRRRSQKITGSPMTKHRLSYGSASNAGMQTAQADAAAAGTRNDDPVLITSSSSTTLDLLDTNPPSSSSSLGLLDTNRPRTPRFPPQAQRAPVEDQECLMSMVTTTNQSPEPQQDVEEEEELSSDLE